MIKSGETYYGELADKNVSFLEGVKDRPRNIFVPCHRLQGLITPLQSLLWDPIKKIVPGFVQGLTKDQMTALFRHKVSTGHRSISLDGSAFDSTQLASLM